ncbi:MAG TPA: FlgT C-terminal domain-containing protein [Candidatus Acidoferrum sp.]|nr:FlgT C-terminal domain-containing protein [Candidatus Acidoferrum sp.]
MRANLAALCLAAFAGAGVCYGQVAPATTAAVTTLQPGYTTVYCSGFLKDTKLPEDIRVVSGEQAGYKVIFSQRENVYLNRGSDNGVKVGDRFMVVRQNEDPDRVEWFKGQNRVAKAMGILYSDIGQVRVANVQPKTSIAEVVFSCDYMQRGDIARPFEERAAPPYKEAQVFDHFAPVSGKPVGMVVTSSSFQEGQAQGITMYVNLGAAQGVKVGDYLRIFRQQGKEIEYVPQTRGYATYIYGFGGSPARYEWKELPREVLGEGIVLNASRNAATVLVTYSSADVFAGDNVEIE